MAEPGLALLVVDLEGVAGVDRLEPVLYGTPGHTRACARLAAELAVVVEGLRAGGARHVVVSDSHRSGSGRSNLEPAAIPEGASLVFEADGLLASQLASGRFDRVAALGMHAATGTAGFVAHCIDIGVGVRVDGAWWSETDLLLELAARAGTPAVFVSGDDVLAAGLQGRVPTVVTKRALGLERAESRPIEAALAELRAAAARPSVPVRARAEGPLELVFKSAGAAARAAIGGGARLDRHAVRPPGADFTAQYLAALDAVERAAAPFAEAVRGRVGHPDFVADVTEMVRRQAIELIAVPPPGATERARDAFLRLTEGAREESIALRALILVMLERHAPGRFVELGLADARAAAVEALTRIPLDLPETLPPDLGLARIDAWYLRRQLGLDGPRLEPAAFERWLHALIEVGDLTYAWLLSEMARPALPELSLRVPQRSLRDDRLFDLYWVTHELLLDTEYLARPWSEVGADRVETLLLSARWAAERGHVDLAGEIALMLQVTGEHRTDAHALALSAVLQAQAEDGAVLDLSMDASAAELADHATGVALLALAGAEARA